MTRFETRRGASVGIEVISSLWDTPIDFLTRDLSPRGAYVRSELLPDPGDHVICSFDLGCRRPFELFAEVVRVNLLRRAGDGADPGFGLRFLDARPFDRLRIRQALANTPPPRPDGHRLRAGPSWLLRRGSFV
ncbi:MAG TPA: PilZ domain-containing protein [Polyangia bacterium]|nr:PilZ domain-containing protein [Polyangia bacterium]